MKGETSRAFRSRRAGEPGGRETGRRPAAGAASGLARGGEGGGEGGAWLLALRGPLRALALLAFGVAAGALASAGGKPAGVEQGGAMWAWALGAGGALFLAQLALGRASRRAAGRVRPAIRFSPRHGSTGLPDLASVLRALPDPCIAVDRRGVVLGASPATATLFPHVAPGRPLAFSLRAPEFVAALEAVLGGDPGQTVHVAQRVPVERHFEVVTAPLENEGRRGALVVVRDLTERQRVEQMRVDFIANASHELRTPLATVMGFIETLQGPARDDPGARERFLGIMREQALRMKRLIDDLLSLSRIEGRSHQPPSGPVDLADVAAQISDTLRPMAEQAGVAVSCKAPAGGVAVPGERDELLRVVENLVENAVKYGESGKRVDVTVSVAAPEPGPPGAPGGPEEAVLAVRDYGGGVPPDDLPRLTERFYRVEGGGKGGSGLGLAIVKHIVTRHRGRMQIESTPGAGTLVRVTLPLYRGAG